MPKKPNRTDMQEYVPAGNGDASGEYADEGGNNVHFTTFANPNPTSKLKAKEEKFGTFAEPKALEEMSQEELDDYMVKDTGEPELDTSPLFPEVVEKEEPKVENKSQIEKGTFYNKLNQDNKDYLDTLSIDDEKELLLLNVSKDYTKEILDNATDDDIKELSAIEMIEAEKQDINNDIIKVAANKEKYKKNFLKKALSDPAYEIGLEGVWKDKIVYPKDYTDLLESGSVAKKKQYFEEAINKETNETKVAELQDKLAKLEEFETNGLNYFYAKQKAEQDYIDLKKDDKYDKKIAKLSDQLSKLPSQEELNAITSKFSDPNNVYSTESKNKAIWCDDIDQSKKAFTSLANKQWKTMNSQEKEALKDYTGNFSKYNEPLRKISYAGTKAFSQSVGGNAAAAITNMTNAIDKCVSKEGAWVQRGINDTAPIFFNSKLGHGATISSFTSKQLQDLVGTTFKENGFYSAGAAKNTGFHWKPIIINTYCPKGTKMCYIQPHSDFEGENEMILQRGYEYKITKIKQEGGKTFIDCEVILGSDEDKPTGEELKTHLSKYIKD